jgi:hypothetical protein
LHSSWQWDILPLHQADDPSRRWAAYKHSHTRRRRIRREVPHDERVRSCW